MSDDRARTVSPADGDNDVGALLRLVGRREPAPADRMARLKADAHAHWLRHTRARRRRLAAVWSCSGLAAAALVVLAIRVTNVPDVSAVVATVEASTGEARLGTRTPGRPGRPGRNDGAVTFMNRGDHVLQGDDVIASGAGVASLRLTSGAQVRMPGGTTLRLAGVDALELREGTVYVDSGGASLEVRTSFGVVRDVGTQFEVRLGPSSVRVRVREGHVQVRRDGQQHDVRPGDEITLDAQGTVARRTIPVNGGAWAWIQNAAEPFELEGRSLHEFLVWISTGNGWRLEFAQAGVEEKARTTTLHGSIQGLTPEEALAAVLPASGVEHRLERGVLTVGFSAAAKE